jgi:hypothetical protein
MRLCCNRFSDALKSIELTLRKARNNSRAVGASAKVFQMKTPCLMFPSNRAVVPESQGLEVQGPPDTKSPRTQHSRTTGDDQKARARSAQSASNLRWEPNR